MNLGIAGRHAVITGGCTGIGRAIAVELATEGARVTVTSRSPDRVGRMLAELEGMGADHHGVACEITEVGQPERVVQEATEKFGPPEILVNNVGDTLGILDPYCPVDDWHRLFDLILGVAIRMNNLVIPAMRAERWGRIVNITAGAGMENSGPVPYSSLKAAFTAYTRSTARVLALERTGIVMSAVLPGVVLTEEGHWASILSERPKHAEAYLRERTVLGRFGRPDEISAMVALLCSERASFCVGSIVPVEGGQARHYFPKVED